MARITKYLLLALVVAVAFNHAAKAQETEEAAVEEEAVEPAVEEGGAEPAVQPEGEGTVGSPIEEEENVTVGSIKKIGSWLSKFGWWNIWKGIGLKEAGEWWKWDKIFKDDWWKKKWFLLGSRFEGEESRMMLVLSDPEARSMGVNVDEEDATYFLAPPGFENELAKRGIAVSPSIVPAGKKQKKQQQRSQQRQPQQLQKTHYTQPWLQRAFPGLDVYDREGGQGSEIDSIRVRPIMQSASRSMVTSLKQQIPDIIPLQSSALNTPMYAYDKNGVMQLVQQESPIASLQQYQVMMNQDTQNPAVLREYQQSRNGYQEAKINQEPKTPTRDRTNSKTEPEGLLVPMSFPKSNSITTKEEIERALNDEHTQKMLEQYARKNWKTIRKDAIILKFVPKTDMEARSSVKRQATMLQDQTPMPMAMPRQMFSGDQLHDQVNSAYTKDFENWAAHQERTMQMQDQQFRQITPMQMQTIMEQEPRQELPKPMMQHAHIMQQAPVMQQEPRQMIQNQQQMHLMPMIQQVPMVQQEPRQSIQEQTPMMHQQQTPVMQQHTMFQQEPRQWIQEQPIMQQMPRQWIQEQPHQQPMMMKQETMPQQEPRQWVQEQQWMSVDPKILDDLKPRQMVHQTLEHTQNGQPLTETTIPRADGGLIIPDETKLNNKDDQHPIVSDMGPQNEENARFFKKALLKSRPSHGAHYVTHNYNIYSTDAGYGSGGYGSGYGAGSGYGGGHSYGGGPSYGGGHNGGYESSYGGSYGGGHGGSYYGNHGAGYGGSSYGGSHGGGYRSTELGETPTKLHQLQDPDPYRSSTTVNIPPIIVNQHVDDSKMLSYLSETSQNKQEDPPTEHHANQDGRTIAEQQPTTNEHPRLAKRNLSPIHYIIDHRVGNFRFKREYEKEDSKLDHINHHRSRRSASSIKDSRRSKRQVSYGGNHNYGTFESIPASSLHKLREGYKDSLKEITLQPNEDPAAALMRYNSESIQEALYRANADPIEVNGTPGQTVVHDQSVVPAILPAASNNLHSYQNQWPSQSPLYMVENVGSPMIYKNGNFYPNPSIGIPQNGTVNSPTSVYPNPQIRNQISDGRVHHVPQHGNGAQQYVAEVPQKGTDNAKIYAGPYVSPESVPNQSQGISYGPQQYRGPAPLTNPAVVNNPYKIYQQQTTQQFPRQVNSAPIGYNNPLPTISVHEVSQQNPYLAKGTGELALRDYLGDQLLNPTLSSFNELMEAIKNRLTNCCHKCKKHILKGINSRVISEGEQDQSDNPEECLTCRASTEIYSDLKNIHENIIKNNPPTPTSKPLQTHGNRQHVPYIQPTVPQSQNTFRYYREPSAINRQKPTQAMRIKKTKIDDENLKFDDLPIGKNYYDTDYDYDIEGDYGQDHKGQDNSKSAGYRYVNRASTTRAPRLDLDNDHLERSGYIYKSRPRSPKPENVRPTNRSLPPANSMLPNTEGYEKRRPQEISQYRRVNTEQGRKRLTSRSGPKENKESGYNYEKQMMNDDSFPKNSGYDYTTTAARVRKQKKPKEQTSESPCKKIQKQLDELQNSAENLAKDDKPLKEGEVLEKKAKLIELLYFLYEMSKCSMGEQLQTTTESVPTSTVVSVSKDSNTPRPLTRRIKLPKKKEVKTVDYSTIRQAEGSNKNGSEFKKVRSVEYYDEDW